MNDNENDEEAQKPTKVTEIRDADADNHKTATTTRRQWRQLDADNDKN